MNYLVFDVGGSAIKYALMDKEANIKEKGSIKTPMDSFESFKDVIGELYDQYIDQIDGIAMSLPGIIDSENGYAKSGGALFYNCNQPIVELLKERCPTSITIENDGKSAALGELWKGTLKGRQHGLVVVIGSGIGGGIIIDGKLYKGANFSAGEFSALSTNSHLPTQEERLQSCWAMDCGVYGLIRPVAKLKNLESSKVDGIKVFEYIENNDEDVLAIFDSFCEKIAIQLFNLQFLFDPEVIAIGGGISIQPKFVECIQKHVEAIYAFNSQHPFGLAVKPNVVKCYLSNDANLVGALYSHLNR